MRFCGWDPGERWLLIGNRRNQEGYWDSVSLAKESHAQRCKLRDSGRKEDFFMVFWDLWDSGKSGLIKGEDVAGYFIYTTVTEASELGGTGDVNVGDVPMDLDDNKFDLVGNVRSGSEEEDFENLTDGEAADDIVNGATDVLDDDAAAIQAGKTSETGLVEREEAKKKGTRKALFKQTGLAVGISNKKFVQVVLSPRKRGHAKSGTRQGDGMKQATDKGTSNPKAGSSKP
ncbi:unnamed protein product [Eruca vesicaria subsp. sativa]|uniref:Uncharacterized protein n=1 Tax=Eruca vesicaria subsp. sativa TaxID=29727 RepID=A0ABC8JQD3_ERUVS|nr:unnamed protein product [Eruca vesicaria subsp. sativa]